MRAVILAGGSIHNDDIIRQYIRPDDFIICADSGYDHAVRMGISPQIVVGDLDSVEEDLTEAQVLGQIEVLSYPPEKDYTDTELTVETALDRGADSILFLAATGFRLDHTIANILLLRSLLDEGIDAAVVDEHNEIRMLCGPTTLQGRRGALVSLIPVTDCSGVTTSGLQYPLDNATLPLGISRGVSNVFLGDTAQVTLSEGYLLAIQARD